MPACPGTPVPTTSAIPILPPSPARLHSPARLKRRSWSRCPIATEIRAPRTPSARTPSSAPWATCCAPAVRSATSRAISCHHVERLKRKRRETKIPRRRDRLRMLQGGGAVEPGLEALPVAHPLWSRRLTGTLPVAAKRSTESARGSGSTLEQNCAAWTQSRNRVAYSVERLVALSTAPLVSVTQGRMFMLRSILAAASAATVLVGVAPYAYSQNLAQSGANLGTLTCNVA